MIYLQIKVSVKRLRREFGAPCEFKDRNATDAKDGFIECTPYEDKSFDLRKTELTKSVQAIPIFTESSSQTEWKYPRNAATQYYPREFSEDEKQEIEKSKDLKDFINEAVPK